MHIPYVIFDILFGGFIRGQKFQKKYIIDGQKKSNLKI
jgi:hypothetical protein